MKPQKSGTKFLKQIIKHIYIAALIFGAALIFSGCEDEIEKIKAFSSPESLPVVSAIDFETTFTDSFKIQSYMKTPLLQKFELEGKSFFEFPKGILLVKYNSNEKIISHITAEYAKQFDKEKKWEAKNNVIAVNALGDTLKTELLIWEENTGKIYSDKFVKIIRTDQIITGIGFESDQNLQNWKIKNPKGTLYVAVKKDKTLSEEETLNPDIPENKNKPLQFNN